jgi:WD40 repeat protein/tRNA A-37 threonylcarbamoyl transferase component Bud32
MGDHGRRRATDADGGLSGVSDDFGLAGGPWAEWQEDDLAAGTDLGGVVIVGLLGRGGMGRVYEARQVATDRRVAVKVLRPGIAGPAALRRFDSEARVLARLQHPHVAQVHACGTFATATGPRPFIVMELVEAARSLTEHAAGLPIRDRMALLERVCDAVAHGHGKGVVHRDIKPGNILVDAAGTPKVIDFGVARTLDAGAAGTAATAAGDLVGTLRYMSPEQLGADPDDVDARSDVYALGLVMHELVTGDLPYELSGKTPVEAARILDGLVAAAPRGIEEAVRAEGRMRPAAARSLAAITAKCLEPRAADRYPTAAELRVELGRWLAGGPVLARPPSVGESLARFVRRHHAAAAAVGGVLVSLLISLAGIAVFAVRAESARRLAVEAQAIAEARRGDADRQAAEARSQLYLSTVLLAAEARDRGNVAEAARLLASARDLGGGTVAGRPLELDCLAASLDESSACHVGHHGTVTAVAWSADGRRLATGAADGTVQILSDGAAGPGTVSAGHTDSVWMASFSPDGRLLATASADGTVRIRETETAAELVKLEPHAGPAYAAAFAPHGRLLATAGRDGAARLWETATWREQAVLAGHGGSVYAAAFSPDGSLLATGDRAGTLRLWDVTTGTTRGELAGHEGQIFRAAFAADGRRLATVSADGTARVWDVATGDAVAVLRHPSRVNAAAFVGDGSRLVTGCDDALLRVWSVEAAVEVARLRGHVGGVWSLGTVPGTSRAATGSADGTTRVWDLDGATAPVVRCGSRPLAVAFAPDGGTLAVGVAEGAVELFDAATLLPAGRLEGGAGRVNGVAFTADGQSVAGACDDGAVRIWSRQAPGEAEVIPAHTRRAYSVAFSADGRLMATAGEDRAARIHDRGATAAARRPLAHPGRVFCAAFSPDARLLATAGEDGVARLWHVASGAEERRLQGHGKAVNWVAFDPTGARLATASSDRTVRLWAVADGKLLTVLTGPAGNVWKVAFSPDGSRVAAVSADGTAQLWDAASGRSAAMLRGHVDQVWGVAFGPDGGPLVTGSWDGTVRFWSLSAGVIARRRGLDGL